MDFCLVVGGRFATVINLQQSYRKPAEFCLVEMKALKKLPLPEIFGFVFFLPSDNIEAPEEHCIPLNKYYFGSIDTSLSLFLCFHSSRGLRMRHKYHLVLAWTLSSCLLRGEESIREKKLLMKRLYIIEITTTDPSVCVCRL